VFPLVLKDSALMCVRLCITELSYISIFWAFPQRLNIVPLFNAGLQNVQQAVEHLRALDETMISNRGFAIKAFSKQMADFLCTDQDLYLVKCLIQTLQKKL
jgi:ABC-type amino acid transport system permease subunit